VPFCICKRLGLARRRGVLRKIRDN
jgi:hypothetical protein